MIDKEEGEVLIKRRALILGAAQLGLTGIILSRMYFLQVHQASKYRLLADKNRIYWRFKPAPRGRILDAKGQDIALNQPSYHLVLNQQSAIPLDKTLVSLERWINLNEEQKKRILRDKQRNPAYIPVIIKDNLSWEEVAELELNSEALPGVYIEVGYKRLYPYGEVTSPITGYVSLPDKQEVEKNPLLRLPGLRVGKQGVEKTYQHTLEGNPANEQLEVNAHHITVRKLSGDPGKAGESLHLHLHASLQKFCYEQLLPHRSGSCVVLDIVTGGVLAMVSLPTYDPNLFVDSLSHHDWQELRKNPFHPLTNKAISALYPPASTFKMIVALAALEARVITPSTRFYCNTKFTLGNHTFHCWHHTTGHGSVNLVQAIACSCDIYFYEVALKVGSERIIEMAQRFGFGVPTGIDLPNEKAGFLPTLEWRQKYKKYNWRKGDTLNLGIGQGLITCTPLQLAIMTATLARRGSKILPCLAQKAAPLLIPSLSIDPQHLRLVLEGMYDVVNRPSGTAYTSRLGAIEMAGKTGSAQVRRITLEERRLGLHRHKNRPWHYKEHSLFVGFAPFEHPRYALSVVIEHGGGGSTTAAPLASKIMQNLLL